VGKGLVNVSKRIDEIEDEAAAWLARLNADRRDVGDEAAFRAWRAQDPQHQAVFEDATAIWELAGGLPREMLHETPKPPRMGRREVMAGLAVTAVVAGTFTFWGRAEAKVYETAIGERRTIVFEDRSVVTLDTDTRIGVQFNERRRLVDLQRGRVNFQVSSERDRPFIVSSANETIVARQSNFDVRRDGDQISVLLIDGHISVEKGGRASALQSGQRLVASADGMRVDKPNLLPLLAWQKGQAILENEKLTDAVAEMNRYSDIKVTIGDRAITDLRVSGVYKVGDNLSFARSIARLLPLKVQQSGDRVLLFMDAERMRQG
jgi:transmembrane sensor